MTEKELIYNLKRREETAFKELVFSHSKKLMTVAKIYTSDTEEAKDVLQDAFVVVFEKVQTFQGDTVKSLLAWIKRIMINIALSKNQKKYKHLENSLDNIQMDFGAENQIINNLSHDEIVNMVMKIPEGYKQVFALHVIEGYSHKEIAEKLEIKESTSRSQFLRARKLLQIKINELTKVKVR